MCAEHKKDEEAIYCVAIAKSPTERTAYLKAACGNDADLLARVEALLQARDVEDGFLEPPVAGVEVTFDETPLSEGLGTKIGRYKLLELIGEGGFGVVYMAEQREPIRRRVALKIIKLGMDTKQVIARFEAERQALAMMEHPNIAKVFDAGATETGRPYFVMELVKGIPVTEYCDKNNLDTHQRLEIFIDVCKAVQHAHQKGIIHRDIKPSNILITLHDDGAPLAKVIDFGIAKATQKSLTEKTLFTEFHQFVGTPEYMSPEQAQMSAVDVDTRSDIYSLGVLLYELLTSRTPFERKELLSASYDQMLKIIRETEPPKPSACLHTLGDMLTEVAKHRQVEPGQLSKIISGDLDWIVLKTLEKDRARRYETANELAADIQRHLGDEPVIAGPPSSVYRMRKFVRRNRTAVVVVLAILTALIIGLSLATVGFVQASRQRDRAVTAEIEAVTQRDTAKQAREEEATARAEAERQRNSAMLARTAEVQQRQRAEANFQKAREAVDQMLTQVAEELPRLPGMPERLDPPQVAQIKQALLEDALEFFEGFLEERSSDPLVRYETAHAHLRVGDITRLMRQYERAEETYVAAASLLEELAAEFPNELNYHMDLARTYDGQADLLMDMGRLKEAEKAFREAGVGYSKAIELDPGNSAHWHWRGETYWKMKQWDKAVADLSQAISLNPNVARYWSRRAFAYSQMGQRDRAIADFSKAMELNPNDAPTWHFRANYYADSGQWDKTIADISKAILLEPEEYRHWGRRAWFYSEMGQWDKAIADFSKAIEVNPNDTSSWEQRFNVYLQLGQVEKGLADYSKAIELASTDAADPQSRRRLAQMYRSLAHVLEKMGRFQEAQEAYRKAKEIEKEMEK